MDIVFAVLPMIYIILIFIFIKKAITASLGKRNGSHSSSDSIFDTKRPKKIQMPVPPKQSSKKDISGGSFLDSERKKEHKKPFRLFGRLRNGQEVDCDLDERVFGPKGQHKDLF